MDLEMSFMQKNVWKMIKKNKNSCIGNIGGILHMDGGIPAEHIKNTINRVQFLNPALRLCVNEKGTLYLNDTDEVEFEVLDVSDMDDRDVENQLKVWMNKPVFSINHILVKYYLLLGKEENMLFGIYHHLICDGIGLQKVTHELHKLSHDYDNELWSEDITPDKRYIEYLEGIEEYNYKPDKRCYLDALQISDHDLKRTFPKRRESCTIEADYLRYNFDLKQFVCEEGYTFEQAFLAVLILYYQEITGSNWICVGRVVMNRNKKFLDTAGMFANTLPLLIQVSAGDTVRSLCSKIKKQSFEMLKCSNLPIELIQQKLGVEGVLYDTSITYRPLGRLPKDNQLVAREMECNALELPLRILLDEYEDHVMLTYKFRVDSFSKKEIEDLNETLLERIKKEFYRQTEVSQIPGKEIIISNQCDMTRTYFSEFYKNVKNIPNKILWIDECYGERREISYEKAAKLVEGMSDIINHKLHQQAFGEQKLIGLQLKRTYYMPLMMMAVMHSGNIFYPIDTNEKSQRLSVIKEEISLLITDEVVDEWMKNLSVNSLRGQINNEGELAYVINTSGSTGEAKLVKVYMESLVIRLQWMLENFSLSGCRILQKTKNTFDVSIWELLLPAYCGGTLVLTSDGEERNPQRLWQMILHYHVDTIHFVPSMLAACLNWIEVKKDRELQDIPIKNLFASGEKLPLEMVKKWYQLYPGIPIHNLYGPAECTIDVTWHTCLRNEKEVTIGRPVWNTEVLIVNENLKQLPDGYIGELLIVGDLVGGGYYHNDEISKERFVDYQGYRAYKSGDLGYINDAGEIVYIGRKDHEVKLRGMRINLEVLESEATSIPGVEVAVSVLEKNRLYLFVKSNRKQNSIREELQHRVAKHYLPDLIVCVEQIPYKENGKCDKKRLIADTKLQSDGQNKRQYDTSEALVVELKNMISEKLQTKDVDLDTHLDVYGLDSLTALEILIELEKRGYEISYEDIYYARDIRSIAACILSKETINKANKSLRVYPEWTELNKTMELDCSKDAILKIVIAVPYAGMEFHVFHNLAKACTQKGYLFMACKCRENDTVEEVAKNVKLALNKYLNKKNAEMVLVGCCVGSALAIEIAHQLDKVEGITQKLVLIGSLPTCFIPNMMKKEILIWDIMHQRTANHFLSVLFGKEVSFKKGELDKIKKEAKIYVRYFVKNKLGNHKIGISTYLIYGKEDYLTKGYQKKYKKWKQYLKGHVRVISLSNASHFCVESHGGLIADKIIASGNDKGEKNA